MGIIVFFILLCWLGWAGYQTCRLYRHIKSGESLFSSRQYTGDTELGFANIGNFRSGNVRIREDSFGLSRPLVLALGGSFTYGYACDADEAYPYITGKKLNGSSLNAGLVGAGLSQMLILARRLIPKYKPDYVLVQYSPWLVRRAAAPFNLTSIHKIPRPYFADSNDGSVILQPPAYRTKFFDIPDAYQKTPAGIGDYLSFLINVGIPLYMNEHLGGFGFSMKKILGYTARPSKNHVKIIETVYGEIAGICRENDATLIIVMMGGIDRPRQTDDVEGGIFNPFPKEEVEKLYEIKNTVVINTMPPLLEKLDKKNYESYSRAYHHWRGTPPVCYDRHPNPAAHEIIGQEIIAAIKNSENKQDRKD